MTELLQSSDVAKLLGLTPEGVRAAARQGRIRPVARTAGGVRLFSLESVNDFKRERSARTSSPSKATRADE